MRKADRWSKDGLHYQPRRVQKAEEIRRCVISASRLLLAEVGPRRFTVVEAARRAGVGRTSVYKYFGLKAGLLAACRDQPPRPMAGTSSVQCWQS